MKDLIIIGGGSAGVAAAKKAADFGQSVLLCERDKMGGTCVSYGCVPKKIWHSIAHYRHSFELATSHGWSLNNVSFSWEDAATNCRRYVSELNDRYHSICSEKGIEILTGAARLVDSNTVEVNDVQYQAKKILIAVGSKPMVLDVEGTALCDHSTDFFAWKSLPQSIVIIGGGYIAVELASILNALGVRTEMVIRKNKVLHGFDTDLQTHVQQLLLNRGIVIHSDVHIESFEDTPNGIVTRFSSGHFLTSDRVLQAVGRNPNTSYLGCSEIGVACDDSGAIIVDEAFQTSIPSIFAIGDCIDTIRLTPVAIAQARKWAHTQFSTTPFDAFFECIPTAVFALPEVATVGLTQVEAEEQFDNVTNSLLRFRPLSHILDTGLREKVFMKLVYEGVDQRVVGAHISCDGASEIIQTLAISIQKGIYKRDLDHTMALHPSIAEELVTIY